MPDLDVYGAPWCPHCRRAKRFLEAQRVEFDYHDIDSEPNAVETLERLQGGGRTIPMVVFPDGTHSVNPSNGELAKRLGVPREATRAIYDLAIVGGGPAGLAAALYAAREGMEAIVVESSALGGNAALTEQIANYPGFPEGIDGRDLSERFVLQARRYDVELLTAVRAEALVSDDRDIRLVLDSGQETRRSRDGRHFVPTSRCAW